MSNDASTTKVSGTFSVSPNRSIYGELTLGGRNISLYLRDDRNFNVYKIPDRCILGTLHDLRQISLIDCESPGPGMAGTESGAYHFAKFHAHYSVIGLRHLRPTEKIITQIAFVMDDASTLFYDIDAFSIVHNPQKFIQQLVLDNAEALGRTIPTGPEPLICYFTGNKEIVAAETVIGRISVAHSPSFNMDGPNGVRINNKIFVCIDFRLPRRFTQAIMNIIAPLQFFAILVGRAQNLSKVSIRVEASDERPCVLEVKWGSQAPRCEPPEKGEKPHPADVLMDAVHDPTGFSRVLANWLDRHQTWENARGRFASSFVKQNEFSFDRLIGAANMFDILPSSVVPRELPLAEKIRRQAGRIVETIGDQFPDLTWVIDEAVACRVYYVHGGQPRFNYNRHFASVIFLTRTLEFVFAATDLIQAGWNAKAWSERATVGSHFFSRYLLNYAAELRNLKALTRAQEG